jgi:hypothetical protein
MELGTASILVQLLLIFFLVAVFTGRRYLRVRRERRNQHPGSATLSTSPAPAPAPAARAGLLPVPHLVDLPPMARRAAGAPQVQSLVSEELLPPCFADTCADWAQVDPVSGKAADAHFSLSDWSAPTDRMALDHAPDPTSLDWALEVPLDALRPARPASGRSVASSMSCTIAPQVRHCA